MATAISREELKAKIDVGEDFILVDVLSADSYQSGHLPGAINLPVSEIESLAPQRLPKDKDIIVYCASFECQASPTAARKLEQLGHTRVIDYEGGLRDWKEAGYPLESPAG